MPQSINFFCWRWFWVDINELYAIVIPYLSDNQNSKKNENSDNRSRNNFTVCNGILKTYCPYPIFSSKQKYNCKLPQKQNSLKVSFKNNF